MSDVPEFGGRPKYLPVGTLLRAGRIIYVKLFWFFMLMFVPAALASYGIYSLANQKLADFLAHADRTATIANISHISLVAATYGWSAKLLSWVLYCFVFVGVSEAVRLFDEGSSIGMEESLRPAREHFGAFLLGSLVQFFLFLLIVGVSLALYLNISLLRVFPHPLPYWADAAGTMTAICFGLAVYSRWALGLPVLAQEGFHPIRCLSRSAELCAYVEIPVILLIVEAALATYAAFYVPPVVFNWLAIGANLPNWTTWIPFGVTLLMVLMIEPVLFIGLSVAYFRAKEQKEKERHTLVAAGISSN